MFKHQFSKVVPFFPDKRSFGFSLETTMVLKERKPKDGLNGKWIAMYKQLLRIIFKHQENQYKKYRALWQLVLQGNYFVFDHCFRNNFSHLDQSFSQRLFMQGLESQEDKNLHKASFRWAFYSLQCKSWRGKKSTPTQCSCLLASPAWWQLKWYLNV